MVQCLVRLFSSSVINHACFVDARRNVFHFRKFVQKIYFAHRQKTKLPTLFYFSVQFRKIVLLKLRFASTGNRDLIAFFPISRSAVVVFVCNPSLKTVIYEHLKVRERFLRIAKFLSC